MATARLYVGNTIRLTLEISDDDGPIEDAQEVTFDITKPDGGAVSRVLTDGQVIHEDGGIYTTTIDADQRGKWHVVMNATSAANEHAAEPQDFYVYPLV